MNVEVLMEITKIIYLFKAIKLDLNGKTPLFSQDPNSFSDSAETAVLLALNFRLRQKIPTKNLQPPNRQMKTKH